MSHTVPHRRFSPASENWLGGIVSEVTDISLDSVAAILTRLFGELPEAEVHRYADLIVRRDKKVLRFGDYPEAVAHGTIEFSYYESLLTFPVIKVELEGLSISFVLDIFDPTLLRAGLLRRDGKYLQLASVFDSDDMLFSPEFNRKCLLYGDQLLNWAHTFAVACGSDFVFDGGCELSWTYQIKGSRSLKRLDTWDSRGVFWSSQVARDTSGAFDARLQSLERYLSSRRECEGFVRRFDDGYSGYWLDVQTGPADEVYANILGLESIGALLEDD